MFPPWSLLVTGHRVGARDLFECAWSGEGGGAGLERHTNTHSSRATHHSDLIALHALVVGRGRGIIQSEEARCAGGPRVVSHGAGDARGVSHSRAQRRHVERGEKIAGHGRGAGQHGRLRGGASRVVRGAPGLARLRYY